MKFHFVREKIADDDGFSMAWTDGRENSRKETREERAIASGFPMESCLRIGFTNERNSVMAHAIALLL